MTTLQTHSTPLTTRAHAGPPLVLCVDDDLAVLSALRRLFRDEPFELATAPSAAQGLALLRQREPHVIVSDERMPGTSGSEFLGEVRERWPWVGRVILTAYPGPEMMIRGMESGIDFLLSKPWDAEMLKKTLRRLIHEVERSRGGADDDGTEVGTFDLGGEGG